MFLLFFGFWLLLWSLSCLESCGRLLGKIPTKSGPNPRWRVRVMTKNPPYGLRIVSFSQLLASDRRISIFLTSDSDSACRNPPLAHLQTPGNLQKQGKSKKRKTDFTHFVFPHFSRLTVKITHFRPEHRIPDAKLCMLQAGMVWNHEIWSKRDELDF